MYLVETWIKEIIKWKYQNVTDTSPILTVGNDITNVYVRYLLIADQYTSDYDSYLRQYDYIYFLIISIEISGEVMCR